MQKRHKKKKNYRNLIIFDIADLFELYLAITCLVFINTSLIVHENELIKHLFNMWYANNFWQEWHIGVQFCFHVQKLVQHFGVI